MITHGRDYLGCGGSCVCGWPRASEHLGHMTNWKGGLMFRNNYLFTEKAWTWFSNELRRGLKI